MIIEFNTGELEGYTGMHDCELYLYQKLIFIHIICNQKKVFVHNSTDLKTLLI